MKTKLLEIRRKFSIAILFGFLCLSGWQIGQAHAASEVVVIHIDK